MGRCVLVALFCVGCGFHVAADGATGTDAQLGAEAGTTNDSAIDTPTGTPLFCDPTDSMLVGCWEFESSGTDGSSYGNHAIPTGVTFAAGPSGTAIVLSTASYLLVPDSTTMDVTSITVEAWVRADNLAPASGRSGIVDNDGQFGLFMYAGGNLWCNIQAPFNITITNALPLGQWTHVACTYTGGVLSVYVNGAFAQSMTGGPAMNTSAAGGTSLGANRPTGDLLEGSLDQLRYWSRARTANEICVAAGSC